MTTTMTAPKHPVSTVAIPFTSLARLSVHQYYSMRSSGILTRDDRVELIDGFLVRKMTMNPPHRHAMLRLLERLRTGIPPGWHVASQIPITLSTSAPEPDVLVIRGGIDDYPRNDPGPGDLGIVAEVSDSRLDYDRVVKQWIYAADQIAVYWIVNLPDERIEVYSEPTGSGESAVYGKVQHFDRNDEVPVVLDGHEVGKVRVADVLP